MEDQSSRAKGFCYQPVWRQRGQLTGGEGGEEPAEAEHLGRAPAPGLAVHLLRGQPRREVGRRVRGQGALERGEVGGGEGGEAGVGHQRGPLRAAEAAQQLAQRGRLRGAQGVGGGLLVGGEVVVQQLDGVGGVIVGRVAQMPARLNLSLKSPILFNLPSDDGDSVDVFMPDINKINILVHDGGEQVTELDHLLPLDRLHGGLVVAELLLELAPHRADVRARPGDGAQHLDAVLQLRCVHLGQLVGRDGGGRAAGGDEDVAAEVLRDGVQARDVVEVLVLRLVLDEGGEVEKLVVELHDQTNICGDLGIDSYSGGSNFR